MAPSHRIVLYPWRKPLDTSSSWVSGCCSRPAVICRGCDWNPGWITEYQ
tara:strand:+ start:125205 stop:125351 length:147 start_codon:yes stop_codon:yes gene_type:complete